jgi:hypothetical protein
VRIGEEMFATGPFDREHDPADDEQSWGNGDGDRWTDNLVVALAHSAIGVCGAVEVKMGELKGGTEYEKECDERNQQSPRPSENRPDCGVLSHT